MSDFIKVIGSLLILLYLYIIACDVGVLTEQTQLFPADPIQLTDDRWSHLDPAWSPDGTMIAYSHHQTSTKFVRLTSSGENLGTFCWIEETIWDRPALSPDRTKIAYYSYYRGHIWIFSLIDSSEILLTPSQKIAYDAAWSPDGKYIAYIERTKNTFNLSIIPSEGGNPRQITFSDSVNYKYPCWSPDGTEIAVRAYSYEPNFSDIWVVSVKNGAVRQLTSGKDNNNFPAWSPDGSKVAFTKRSYDELGIWVISSQGGEMKKITQDLFPFISSLCWSPDGSHLAFHTSSYTSDSLHNGIWLVSSEGENEYL
ncbi:MAG: PD40 domain-containing protein, partial [bacterium]